MEFIRIEGVKIEIIIDKENIGYLAYKKEEEILYIYDKTNTYITELKIDNNGYNDLLNSF